MLANYNFNGIQTLALSQQVQTICPLHVAALSISVLRLQLNIHSELLVLMKCEGGFMGFLSRRNDNAQYFWECLKNESLIDELKGYDVKFQK